MFPRAVSFQGPRVIPAIDPPLRPRHLQRTLGKKSHDLSRFEAVYLQGLQYESTMELENHHLEKESTEFGDCRILAESNCGRSISSRYSPHKDMFSHHSMTTQIPYNMRHAVLQMKDHIKITQAKPKTSILCKFDQIIPFHHAEHFLGQTTLPSRRGSFAKSWCRAARKPSNGSTSPRFIKHPVLFNWNFPYV